MQNESDTVNLIVTAIAICCEEEEWSILDLNLLDLNTPLFTILAYGETLVIGPVIDTITEQITDEDATLIAIQFKDAVVQTVARIKEWNGHRNH